MNIKRDYYLNKLISKKDNGMVKVVTGLRRSGKTFLLKNIYRAWLISNGTPEKNVVYLALDSNQNIRYRNPVELDNYLRDKINSAEGRCYVIIDEIQYATSVPNPYLPQEVRSKENEISFYDTVLGLMDICDLYITGSNSKMLSSDILTNFRNRGDEIKVYPLSFSEYLTAYKGSEDDAWRDYLYYGGMPFILTLDDPRDKAEYLENLFKKTYITDIIERYKIKNVDDLEKIMDILASSVGSLVNPTNISNTFKSKTGDSVSRNTVAEYINEIKESFLIDEAKRFDIRGREYVSGQQKYYFSDLGLRNCRLNFRQFDLPHLLENAVYNELKMRGYKVDVGRVQSWEKNKSGNYQIVYLESDFVINDADKRIYIQVADGIDYAGKMIQESRSLLHIKDSFPKMILVNQNVPTHVTEEGITVKSVRQFLQDK